MNTNNTSKLNTPNANIHLQQTEILSAKTLIAVAILFIYTISSPIMYKFKFYVIHESGMSMLIGLIVTIIAMLINPDTSFANTLYFDDAVFFTFILPPIIFSAGYNMKRKSFFKYILYTLLFGVLGTIISFVIIASITFTLNHANWFSTDHKILHLSIQEILLFSCVISSTDTLAALTFIKEENDSKLFSILFGEGVFNDAVSIVMYKIITDFAYSKQEFNQFTPVLMIGSFMKLFIFSFLFGVFIGLICTLFLKHMKNYNLNRVQECSIIIFFAFFSYTIAELIGISPIISLLFSAIFMSHYTFYNLSFQAREESSIVSKIMANIAEAFVFTYLGLTFVSISNTSFSYNFLILEFFIVTIARYSSVHSVSFIINLFNSTHYIIKPSEKGIMCFAGSIRGAIAFGLAISIQTGSVRNDEVLVSTILVIVFVTTIVFGALLPMVIQYYKRVDFEMNLVNSDNYNTNLNERTDVISHATFEYSYSHPNNKFDVNMNSSELYEEEFENNTIDYNKNIDENKNLGWFDKILYYWEKFDYTIIKPWLLHNWPKSKIEHEEINIKIKNLFNEFQMSKRILRRNSQEDYELEDNIIDVNHKEEEGILKRSFKFN